MNKEEQAQVELKAVETQYDATVDQKFEDRNHIEVVRDNTQQVEVGDKKVGKIVGYKFTILIRDKSPLVGEFTRDEMDSVYRLYAAEGSNINQRSVSRYFPKYTFQDFKRILRAFNITKASSPLAPHNFEEKTTEELITLTFQNKENDYLKKLEEDRNKINELKVKQLTKELTDLKEVLNSGKNFLREIDLTPIPFRVTKNINNTNTVMIYLSDMHIGAYNSNEGVYENPYDEMEASRRLEKVYQRILNIPNIDHLVIMNLGDSVDGYNAGTTRSGHGSSHILPQNMSNREQTQTYIKLMMNFFNNIKNNVDLNKISYYAVCESNHGGDFENAINVALSYLLQNIGVNVSLATRPIEHFEAAGKTFIYLHGKDNINQFKNFPLTVNDKVELYFGEYIYLNKLEGEIIIVKGDLHQSATTNGKRFKYKSVSSLFGSSNWIHANFGATPWGCDYSIIDNLGNMVDGVIN